jgi:hypothetical protein
MDAASLFEAFRSVGLLAIFLTNAVLLEEPPNCPLQCETRCESCKVAEQPAGAASTSKAECHELETACPACPACPGSQRVDTVVADMAASEKECQGGARSIALTVTHAADRSDGCSKTSCCPASKTAVACESPNHHAIVRVVADATSAGTCPQSQSDQPRCSSCKETASCKESASCSEAGPSVAVGKSACSSCVSTRIVQVSRGAHPTCTATDCTDDCTDDCESRAECPAECVECPAGALVAVCDDEVHGAAVLGHWVADWISGKPKFIATFAVQGVAPDVQRVPVAECGHKKICAGDRCYEVEEVAIEGQTCDQPDTASDTTEVEFQQPIHFAPAAPPLPPSYQFTQTHPGHLPMHVGAAPWGIPVSVREADPIDAALSGTTVSVPANVLTRLLVERATASTRLEMTQGLMEERQAYMEEYLQVVERNMTLQAQLAALEARQQHSDALAATLADRMDAALRVAHRSHETVPTETTTAEQRSEIDTIQEDLTNIRRQIALLKRQPPVPFAPSFMGAQSSEPTVPSRCVKGTVPALSAKSSAYVPVTPTAAPCATGTCPESPASEIGVR